LFDGDIELGKKATLVERNARNEQLRILSAQEAKELPSQKIPSQPVNLVIEGFRESSKNDNVLVGEAAQSIRPLTYGTFEECPCGSQCSNIAVQLQGKLLNVQDSQLRGKELCMPSDLVRRLSHDIATMSQTEPRGVPGCNLYMNLKCKNKSIPLGDVLNFEPNSLATFELNVTLIEEKSSWSGFLNALRALFLPCGSRYAFRSKISISTRYKIVKKKLYTDS